MSRPTDVKRRVPVWPVTSHTRTEKSKSGAQKQPSAQWVAQSGGLEPRESRSVFVLRYCYCMPVSECLYAWLNPAAVLDVRICISFGKPVGRRHEWHQTGRAGKRGSGKIRYECVMRKWTGVTRRKSAELTLWLTHIVIIIIIIIIIITYFAFAALIVRFLTRRFIGEYASLSGKTLQFVQYFLVSYLRD